MGLETVSECGEGDREAVIRRGRQLGKSQLEWTMKEDYEDSRAKAFEVEICLREDMVRDGVWSERMRYFKWLARDRGVGLEKTLWEVFSVRLSIELVEECVNS